MGKIKVYVRKFFKLKNGLKEKGSVHCRARPGM